MPPDSLPHAFSLVAGGPFHDVLRRCGLLRPVLGRLGRRMVALSLLCWLPPLLLALAAGTIVPLLKDVEFHARFLLGLPLLLLAELPAHLRLRDVLGTFLERRLISDVDAPRFESVVKSVLRLRHSAWVEAALLAGAIASGAGSWGAPAAEPSWFAEGGTGRLTPAGQWQAYVSLALFRFLLARWYWRWGLWVLLLVRVARIRLRLNALHPDGAGGLGFLGDSVQGFWILFVAHTAVLAGYVAQRLLRGEALASFLVPILGLVVHLIVCGFGPLLVFLPNLYRAKRKALRVYGDKAAESVDSFRERWLSGHAEAASIQTIGHFAAGFEVVRRTRLFPFTRAHVMNAGAAMLLPLVPLVLIAFPLDEIARRLLKVFF